MPDKKELYLHIGTVKTGTTALQYFCDLNRQVLKDHSISYPESQDNLKAHHRFSWSLALSEGKLFSPNWPSDLASPRDEWHRLKKQCNGQKNLISSENFFNRSSESISTLKHFFSDFKVKVIVYWRRRDHLEDAWYNQRIKRGEVIFLPKVQGRLGRKEQLDKWTMAFGKENIILRPYERGQLYQKDVVADFLHHILGLKLDDELFTLPEKEVNHRLHQVILEYKRRINHLDLVLKQKRKTVAALKDIQNVFNQEGRKTFPVFSPQQRLELITKYAGEYTAIAREYLGRENGELFYDPLPNPDDEWQPYHELLEEDARKINENLAQKYPRVFNLVVRGILLTLASPIKARESALKLLPGIPPERIALILGKILATPEAQYDLILERKSHNLYNSRTWRTGMAIHHLYKCLPSRLQKPAWKLAQIIYRGSKKALPFLKFARNDK